MQELKTIKTLCSLQYYQQVIVSHHSQLLYITPIRQIKLPPPTHHHNQLKHSMSPVYSMSQLVRHLFWLDTPQSL